MNIAIALLVGPNPSGAAEGMLTDFDQAGYQVHVFNSVEDQAGMLAAFPDIMQYIKSNTGGTPARIVLISNYRELLFSWFRCHNSFIDDFVYCCDIHHFEAPENDETQIYKCLADFNMSGRETIQGRIYIDIDLDNFETAAPLLLLNNNFIYFAPYREFDYYTKTIKTPVNKRYYLNKREYDYSSSPDGLVEHILLTTNGKSAAQNDQEFVASINRHPHFVFFYIAQLNLQATPSAKQKLMTILSSINKDKTVASQYYRHYFEKHSQDARLPFQSKVILAYFALQLGITEGLSQYLIRTIQSDEYHVRYHYFLLIQALSYEARLGMQPYTGLYNDRQEILSRISEYYCPALTPQNRPINNDKSIGSPRKIAVLVPQLLNIVHSPTRMILNYCKQLKLDYPEYDIKIFVEDTHVFDSSETAFLPYLFKSVPSAQAAHIHRMCLSPANVDIYYSAADLPRKERLKRDLGEITSFQPDLIWAISSDVSLLRSLLYPGYPVLDMPMSVEISRSSLADLFIAYQDLKLVEEACENLQFNLESIKSGKFVKHSSGLNFAEPQTTKSRADYQLDPDAFVLITVSNRLDSDLTKDFVIMVDSFLGKHEDASWIVVGKGGESAVGKLHPGFTGNRVFIEYEHDLAALYAICDIYINPFRQGGGVSIAMAMYQSLPVVTLGNGSDGATIAGSEFSLKDKECYVAEMERLYADRDYRQTRGRQAKQRIDEAYSMTKAVNEMVGFFAQAIDNYHARDSKG
jgi:glycosyltransferase involved in cell wall biosynthesis